MKVPSARLNRLVRFERPVGGGTFGSAGQNTWEPVATIKAEVQDVLPSRDERLTNGFTVASRRSRVRTRYRTDLTGDMRIALLRIVEGEEVVERTLAIIGGPVELGLRKGLEIMAEDT